MEIKRSYDYEYVFTENTDKYDGATAAFFGATFGATCCYFSLEANGS